MGDSWSRAETNRDSGNIRTLGLTKLTVSFNFGPQLRQWITVLYNNISSCVLNNGFATKHFNLSRGVRQGCPLSGILFVICVETLSIMQVNAQKK